MTDRPMLFSSPMIRGLAREAWVAGDGKTETRRVASPHNVRLFTNGGMRRPSGELLASAFEGARDARDGDDGVWMWAARNTLSTRDRTHWHAEILPKVGDRIWTRETWAPLDDLKSKHYSTNMLAERGVFRADAGVLYDDVTQWTPAIHQPRDRSRFTLIVTKVRLQRLHDITEEDAGREGIRRNPRGFHWEDQFFEPRAGFPTAREAYISLWDHINGEDAWAENPWIVATTFTVHRINIDHMPVAA